MPRPDVLSHLHQLAAHYFERERPVLFGAAHGCLDVLGALEAEGGGTLAQMTLPGEVGAGVQLRPDEVLRIRSAQIAPPVGDSEVTFHLPELAEMTPAAAARKINQLAAGRASWAAGLLALFWLLKGHFKDAAGGGANVLVHGDLPIGAGQASSTALLAAAARAYMQAVHGAVDIQTLAHLLATAEGYAGCAGDGPPLPSRGHMIDALTCLHPREPAPTLLRYSAQPHRFVGPVPLPDDVHIFALDTGVRYTSARATLEELRVAAAMGLRIIETIYRDLGQHHTPLHGYLTNTSPLLYRQYFRMLLPKRLRGSDFVRTYGPLQGMENGMLAPPPVSAEQLDSPRLYRVRTAVDHLIAENEHAEQFLQAMEELADDSSGISPMDGAERQRTLQRAGRLLLASQHSYRLRLELSCREADCLVDSLMEAGPEKGIYGARITGIGGGGTVVALLQRSSQATDALLGTLKAYHQMTGLTLGVTEV